MTESTRRPECPHCNEPLHAFTLPEDTGWEGGFQLACFNDECPYYVRGWDWMNEKYGVKSSYRYRVIPETAKASPLAVWSEDALKDRILEMDASASTETGESEEGSAE